MKDDEIKAMFAGVQTRELQILALLENARSVIETAYNMGYDAARQENERDKAKWIKEMELLKIAEERAESLGFDGSAVCAANVRVDQCIDIVKRGC